MKIKSTIYFKTLNTKHCHIKYSRMGSEEDNETGWYVLSYVQVMSHVHKQGLIAKQLSVLEALIFKVDENIHPWTIT